MTMSEEMKDILKRATDELIALSPEEFEARMKEARKSDLFLTLYYAKTGEEWVEPDEE